MIYYQLNTKDKIKLKKPHMIKMELEWKKKTEIKEKVKKT
jgi:hypothetical protein